MNTLIERVRRRLRAERWSLIQKSRRTVTVRTKQGVFCLSTKDNVISRLLFIEGQYQLDLVRPIVRFAVAEGVDSGSWRGRTA